MALDEVVRFLNDLVRELHIPHAYIGAVAASVRGRIRSTEDADLIILIDAEGIGSLLDALTARGIDLGSRRPEVHAKLATGRPAKIAWDERFSFDLRLAAYAIDLETLRRATEEPSRMGVTLRAAPAEELIVYKLARFAKRDKADIRGIIRSRGAQLHWCRIEVLATDYAKERSQPEILERLKDIRGWA